MQDWMGWTILCFSGLNLLASGARIAQNERLFKWHLRQAKKRKSKKKQ